MHEREGIEGEEGEVVVREVGDETVPREWVGFGHGVEEGGEREEEEVGVGAYGVG